MGRPFAPTIHGTPTAYQWRGCRCPDCRQAQARYRAELKARRTLTRRAAGSSCTPAGAGTSRLKRPSDTWPGRP